MRLNKQQHDAIVTTFLEVFGRGEIRLFGSRVRDDLRGGDIDLYVNPDECDQLAMKRVTYLARLKRRIGDQKIDLAWLAHYEHQRIVNSFLFNYLKIQQE